MHPQIKISIQFKQLKNDIKKLSKRGNDNCRLNHQQCKD